MKRLLVLVAAVLIAGTSTARAIPSDGASSDTAGTSATVSPRTPTAGSTISFTVRGFPAGQTVNVKIDDGQLCTDASHGACVYLQQKIPASGTVSGSFTLPHNLKTGKHWLRFLASAPAPSGNGTVGYTCRGDSDFTVVKAGTKSDAPTQRSTVTASSSASAAASTTAAAGTRATAAPRPADAEPAYAAGKVVTAAPSTTPPATADTAVADTAVADTAATPATLAAAEVITRTSGGSIALAVGVLLAAALAAGGAAWALVRRWG